jgi:hypothetical protein
MDLKYYLDKLFSILRVRSLIGGLDISDSALRFVYFDGKVWHLNGVRLPPGVMEAGKIKDYNSFVSALKTLKSQAFKSKTLGRPINVIVSLSSVGIYSQVFSLPVIKGENLDKAIQLNIQMVSPADISQTYSGWQKISEDPTTLKLEILSSFLDKAIVDELTRALLEAGFLAVVLESRALALSRLWREQGAGFNPNKSYILISLDSSGLDFLIVRRSQLYFDYFIPWRDITDEKGQISMDVFDATIVRSLHQVLNFYGQQWSDPVQEVVVSATGLKEEIEKIVKDNFSLLPIELKFKIDESIGPEWFVALGCGLRSLKPRSKDNEVSLLGIGAEEEFRREQFINFVSLWRILMPVALGLLLITLFLGDLFLVRTRSSLEAQLFFSPSSEQLEESQNLQGQAQEFNRLVAAIKEIQGSALLKSQLLDKIQEFLRASGVTLTRFYFQSADLPIILNGKAKSQDQIVSFKNAIGSEPEFKDVNLPLSGVVSDQNGFSFSMTFKLVSQ